jgi:hypothetical protein
MAPRQNRTAHPAAAGGVAAGLAVAAGGSMSRDPLHNPPGHKDGYSVSFSLAQFGCRPVDALALWTAWTIS